MENICTVKMKVVFIKSKCLSEFTCPPIIDPHRGKRGGARENSGAITFIKEYLPTEKQRGYAHFVPKSAFHENSLYMVIMKEFRINTGLINPSVFKSKINPNAQIRSYRKY